MPWNWWYETSVINIKQAIYTPFVQNNSQNNKDVVMTLKNRFRAALTPSALLPSLGAITAGVLMMTLQTTSAQAAGQYFDWDRKSLV